MKIPSSLVVASLCSLAIAAVIGCGGGGVTGDTTGSSSGGSNGNSTGSTNGATSGSVVTQAGIYVLDSGNNRIAYFTDMTGADWFATGAVGSAGSIPSALTIGANNRVTVTNETATPVKQFDGTALANLSSYGTVGGIQVGQFQTATGVAVNAGGEIFIGDSGNRRLVRLNGISGTTWTTLASGSGPFDFYAVALDQTQKLYCVSQGSDRILQMDNIGGANRVEIGSPGSGVNQFDGPSDIFVDAGGKIYVADTNNHRIVRMDSIDGTGWITLGALGSGSLQFSKPTGVAVDATGRIYVVDQGNSRVVRVDDMSGGGWITFGAKGSGINKFDSPRDIWIK